MNVDKLLYPRPWMLNKCPAACHECDKLLYENRCPYNPDSPRAWNKPNSLNNMFERIISDEYIKQHLKPKVWSRPIWDYIKLNITTEYYDTPWIISLDNFLSDKEVDRLLEIAEDYGYERSDDGGEYLDDGTFQTYHMDIRTSYNSWCHNCYNDLIGLHILNKIENITHIHKKHYNFLQILRYTKGQKYDIHHDYDYYTIPRQPGPRILTFFMYLSDVDEGGGTNFPNVGITFKPKKGRVILWPNVLNDNNMEDDPSTEHQALPVIKGTKYAANAWIHLHDFQGPAKEDCAD